MEKFFNNLLPGAVIHRPGGEIVDLRSIPSHSFDLYCDGFKHLTLKPAAEELFTRLSKEKLQELIDRKKLEKQTEDVKILKKALKLKTSKTSEGNSKKQQKDSESK